jgi:tRNA nucleotidyltransferase (CCA-adding enzyme)
MKIYLVGGAVRDKLLNFPYHERDWVVTGATPDQMLAQGFQQVGKDFPVFLHPETKEEYALARTERKNGKGYTGFQCFSSPDVTLEEDLLRRDLTINAMAEVSGELIDPYGGQRDLQRKILRHVSDAFIEDPLRVLRVARFYARYAHLGFTIADETLALMTQLSDSDELNHLSAERVWKELERALGEQSPGCFLQVLEQCHALLTLLPEWQTVDGNSLNQLAATVDTNKQSLFCFALACSNLPEDLIRSSCQRLKAPKSFEELALLFHKYANRYSSVATSGEALFQRLEELDAFRKTQRFDDFCQLCQQVHPDSQSCLQLQQALQHCLTINAKALSASGLKGKAIGQALKQQRIDAITELV